MAAPKAVKTFTIPAPPAKSKAPPSSGAALQALIKKAPAWQKYVGAVKTAAKVWGADPAQLLSLLIFENASANPAATSSAGAKGLAQIGDATVGQDLNPTQYQEFVNLYGSTITPEKAENPAFAINYAAWRLAGGIGAYGGDLNAYYSGTGGNGKPPGYNPGYSAPGAPPGPVYGVDAPTNVGGVAFTGKSLAGTRQSLVASIAAAAKAAGATQVVVISAKRPAGAGNDVSDSNHITGDAIDGYAVVAGKQVPLGTLIVKNASQFGLRSGDVAGFDPKTQGGFDPNHVDDGANVSGKSAQTGPADLLTKSGVGTYQPVATPTDNQQAASAEALAQAKVQGQVAVAESVASAKATAHVADGTQWVVRQTNKLGDVIGFTYSTGANPPKNVLLINGEPATKSDLSQAWSAEYADTYSQFTGKNATPAQIASIVASGVSVYGLRSQLATTASFATSPIYKSSAAGLQGDAKTILGTNAPQSLVTQAIAENWDQSTFEAKLRALPAYTSGPEFQTNVAQMTTTYQGIYGTPDSTAEQSIKEAAAAGWSTDQFASYLRAQPQYKTSLEYATNATNFLDAMGLTLGSRPTLQPGKAAVGGTPVPNSPIVPGAPTTLPSPLTLKPVLQGAPGLA